MHYNNEVLESMDLFLESIKTVLLKLNKDGRFITDHKSSIQSLEKDINLLFIDVHKSLWFFHFQRLTFLFSKEFYSRNLCGIINSLPLVWSGLDSVKLLSPTELHSCYSNFLVNIRDHPALLAEVLYHFNSNLKIFNSLVQSVLALGSFGISSSDSDFYQFVLWQFLRCNASKFKSLMEIKKSIVILLNSFIFGVPCVYNYSHSIFKSVIGKVFESCVLSSVLESAHCDHSSTVSFKQPIVDYGSLLNFIIQQLVDSMIMFPQPIITFLGNLRHALFEANYSADDVLGLSAEFIFIDFFGFVFDNPWVCGVIDDPVRNRTVKDILKNVTVYLNMVYSGIKCEEILQNKTGTINSSHHCKSELLKKFVHCICNAADSTCYKDDTMKLTSYRFNDFRNDKVCFNSDYSCPGLTMNIHKFRAPVLLTATDLNILVDCIRILLKTSEYNCDDILKLINVLPERVTDAHFGVRKLLITNPTDPNDTLANYCDFLQYFRNESTGNNNNNNNSSTKLQTKRTRSLNRLVHKKNRRAQQLPLKIGPSTATKHNSITSLTADEFSNKLSETVYLFDFNNDMTNNFNELVGSAYTANNNNSNSNNLVMNKFFKDNSLLISDESELNLFDKISSKSEISCKYSCDLDQTSLNLKKSIVALNGIGDRQQKQQQLLETNLDDDEADVDELQSQSPQCESSPTSSLPSGCTSLASSAHALGMIMMHNNNKTLLSNATFDDPTGTLRNTNKSRISGGNQHEEDNGNADCENGAGVAGISSANLFENHICSDISNKCPNSDRTKQFVAENSVSTSIEKRTRFSLSTYIGCRSVKESLASRSKSVKAKRNFKKPASRTSVTRSTSTELLQSVRVNSRAEYVDHTSRSKNNDSIYPHMKTISDKNNVVLGIQPRCSSLSALSNAVTCSCKQNVLDQCPRHFDNNCTNPDTEVNDISRFSMNSNASDNGSNLVEAAVSQRSAESSLFHLNSSFVHSLHNSRDRVDITDGDEQSSLFTCSSCGVRLNRDFAAVAISEYEEHQDIVSGIPASDNPTNQQPGFLRDEEDALSDMHLSSNISGRLTPSSFASTTSQSGVTGYPNSGIILPTGADVNEATSMHLELANGIHDFPVTTFGRHHASDVTAKFHKFDLPPINPTNESQSGISDTWSTDVLPSDTEYTDLNQEFSGLRMNSNSDITSNHSSGRNETNPTSHHPIRNNQNNHRLCRHHHSNEIASCQSVTNTQSELGASSNQIDAQCTIFMLNGADSESVPISASNHNTESACDCSNQHPNITTVTCQPEEGVNKQQSASLAGDLNQSNSVTPKHHSQVDCDDGCDTEVATNSDSLLKQPHVNSGFARKSTGVITLKEGLLHLKEKIDMLARLQRSLVGSKLENNSKSQLQNVSKSTSCSLLPDLIESTSVGPWHSPYSASSCSSVNNNDKLDSIQTDSNVVYINGKHSNNQSKQKQEQTESNNLTNDDCMKPIAVAHSMTDPITPAPAPLTSQHHPQPQQQLSSNGPDSRDNQVSSSPSSSPPAAVLRVCNHPDQLFELVLFGLQELFTDSFISSIALKVIDDIGSNLTSNFYNQYFDLQLFDEDNLFLNFLNTIIVEISNSRHSNKINIIKEISHALCQLKKQITISNNNSSISIWNCSQTVSNTTGDVSNVYSDLQLDYPQSELIHLSVKRTSLCSKLICELIRYRKRRYGVFNQLMETRSQMVQFKCYLKNLLNWSTKGIQCINEFALHHVISILFENETQLFEDFHKTFSNETCRGDSQLLITTINKLVSNMIQEFISVYNQTRQGLTEKHNTDIISDEYLIIKAKPNLEYMVMDTLYESLIWINDLTAERERDVLFYRELIALQNTLTVNELRIPDQFHIVLPIGSVQHELFLLDIYHTSAGKFHCLKQVLQHIVTILQFVHPTSVPGADDILPILIYTIIQANPPRILSNIAFVQHYATDTDGEAEYVWCQFNAALTEIKRLMSEYAFKPMND